MRQVLYDESQGIVDLAVKLMMLVQLQAILLAATTGRNTGEPLTVGLIRHVAKDAFRLIAPMINALRRNDLRALESYDDLRPVDEYMFQAFQAAALRLAPSPAPVAPLAEPPAPSSPSTHDDGREAVLSSLERLGLARDIAGLLLAQAQAENPGLSPLDLITAVIAKLRERGPEANPKRPRKKTVPPSAPADPADLRVIVSAAKEAGLDAYTALHAAGMIKPTAA